jgi:hypothetical protein
VFRIRCEERRKEGKALGLRKGFLGKGGGRVFQRGEGALRS